MSAARSRRGSTLRAAFALGCTITSSDPAMPSTTLYELRLRRAQRGFELVQQHTIPIVRTAIDIHTLATGARTRFEIVSGTEGSLAGVPISVAWQPRWWLKLRLTLIDGVTSAGRVAEKGGSRTLRGSFDPQPDFEDQ